MPVKSLNRYIDPKTGEVLVEIGDTLTQDVVDLLGKRGAVRVRREHYDCTTWDKFDAALGDPVETLGPEELTECCSTSYP